MYFLLTAPHPDDDIIGLADYIQHLQGQKVGVWFMTDGGNWERRVEATKALNLLNVHDIFWNTLPFYRTIDRKVSEQDMEACNTFLQGIRPSTIAICYDADPHQTHIKCYTILQHVLQQAQDRLHRLSTVVLYQSAWGNTTTYPPQCTWKKWTVRDVSIKQAALQCHASQLTLKVHDGEGNNLMKRGNLEEEVYMEMPVASFLSLPPCWLNFRRRTVYTPDIGKFVWENILAPLKEPQRIIFPTGTTPLELYTIMRQQTCPAHQVFQLDEYVNSSEYQDYLLRELPDNFEYHFFNTFKTNLKQECLRHDALCRNVDICILGIGQNGHIGFNEPPCSKECPTRLVDLDQQTMTDNNTNHRQALTLGIETILTAKKIVVMAKQNKKKVLERLFEGVDLPASYLRHHPDVTLVVEGSHR